MNNNSVFDFYSNYYDLFYNDKDYSKEVKYINSLLNQYGIMGNKILEFGSGTGKHGRLLSKNGYSVLGIERSEKMAQKANEKGGFLSKVGDIRSLNISDSFNAVLALFHVMSYQITNDDIIAVFKNAAKHLEPKGLFIFDVWYTPAVFFLKPEIRIKRMKNDNIEAVRIAEPDIIDDKNQIDVNYTIFVREKGNKQYEELSETHSMRHFTISEIDYLASYVGFKRVVAEEFLTGKNPSKESWGVCFILKKI